eukprot:PRCOL_00002780-RA
MAAPGEEDGGATADPGAVETREEDAAEGPGEQQQEEAVLATEDAPHAAEEEDEGAKGTAAPAAQDAGEDAPAADAAKPAGRPDDATPCKVFVGGVGTIISTADLLMFCSKFGTVVDSIIMEGRGFGFVTFETETMANAFMNGGPHVINGRTLDVRPAISKSASRPAGSAPPGSNQPTNKIFVGGLSDVSDEDFKEYFSRFGNTTDVHQVRTADGRARGYGFVTYEDLAGSKACIDAGVPTLGTGVVEVRYAQPRHVVEANKQFGGMGGGFRPGFQGMPGGHKPLNMAGFTNGHHMRPGDWACNSCGNINFSFRTECKKCNAPRSYDAPTPLGPGGIPRPGMGHGPPPGMGYGQQGPGYGQPAQGRRLDTASGR